MKPVIKVNQIWKSKHSSLQIVITGKKGSLWLAKVLTDKPGVYSGSHRMNRYTLWKQYELIQ